MFGFIKKAFVVAIHFFSFNALKSVLINNQEYKIRPQAVNINSNILFFYSYSIEENKSRGSCNNINDPYSKCYVPNAVKT